MNKIQKTIVSMLVIALIAFSTGALLSQAHASGAANYGALPWAQNSLVSPGTLNVWGSSTVGPIASEEIGEGNFVSYWNNLVSQHDTGANAWGTAAALDLSAVNLETAGSGTAIPALAESTGAADIGEMSRPPSDGEFATASMTNMQQYAVGIDSVAIVVDPTMTWFPTDLTTAQVASLFVDSTSGTTGSTTPVVTTATQSPINSPQITWADGNTNGTQVDQGIDGSATATPLYDTWGQFLQAYYGVTVATTNLNQASSYSNLPSTINGVALANVPVSGTINRAVRDPTSGTFDCFDNYFAIPNGYQFEFKAVNGYPTVPDYASPSSIANLTSAIGAQEMAPYTYCEQNINVYDTVSAGNPTTGDYIGFISLGYLQSYGGPQPGATGYPASTKMIGLNIAFNRASPPSGKTTSPVIAYYGSSNTQGFVDSTVNAPNWTLGGYVTPTDANVIWAYSNKQGSEATGQYEAWRWLWEVVPGQIPSTGPLLAAGVWIAYMMADGTTNAATSTTQGSLASSVGAGNSNFVQDQNYIPLERDDFTGGPVIDSNLVAPPAGYPTATQTQSYPAGVVNFNDITYFVAQYINYQVNHIYNPYADEDANGVINFNDIALFVGNYIAYFTTYNPP